MSVDYPRVLLSGDSALLIEFGEGIDRAVNARVLALHRRLAAEPVPGVIGSVPAFRSLLVEFDPEVIGPDELGERLLSLDSGPVKDTFRPRRWVLPVCYDGSHGLDLEDVAQAAGLDPGEVVRLHASQEYFVYMMGFLPGFGYLGELPQQLRLPRRASPRTQVPRGAVAIADAMTAIYPLESPGGWHIIGRCPVPLFNPRTDEPVLLGPGDIVRFAPVPERECIEIERATAAGVWQVTPEIIDE